MTFLMGRFYSLPRRSGDLEIWFLNAEMYSIPLSADLTALRSDGQADVKTSYAVRLRHPTDAGGGTFTRAAETICNAAGLLIGAVVIFAQCGFMAEFPNAGTQHTCLRGEGGYV